MTTLCPCTFSAIGPSNSFITQEVATPIPPGLTPQPADHLPPFPKLPTFPLIVLIISDDIDKGKKKLIKVQNSNLIPVAVILIRRGPKHHCKRLLAAVITIYFHIVRDNYFL